MAETEQDVPRIYPWKRWAQITTLIAAGTLLAILGVDSINSKSTAPPSQVQGGSFEVSQEDDGQENLDLSANKNFQIPLQTTEETQQSVRVAKKAKKSKKTTVKKSIVKKKTTMAKAKPQSSTTQLKQGSIAIPNLSEEPPIGNIRTKDPNILFILSSLAKEHRGLLLLESNRKPLSAVKMTEDDTFRSVVLSVSSQNIGKLKQQINQIGGEIDQIGQQQNDQKASIFLDITYEY